MSRLGSGVAEGFAKLVDRSVQAVVEIHNRVVAPQALPHFLPGHQLGWPFQQHH